MGERLNGSEADLAADIFEIPFRLAKGIGKFVLNILGMNNERKA